MKCSTYVDNMIPFNDRSSDLLRIKKKDIFETFNQDLLIFQIKIITPNSAWKAYNLTSSEMASIWTSFDDFS